MLRLEDLKDDLALTGERGGCEPCPAHDLARAVAGLFDGCPHCRGTGREPGVYLMCDPPRPAMCHQCCGETWVLSAAGDALADQEGTADFLMRLHRLLFFEVED